MARHIGPPPPKARWSPIHFCTGCSLAGVPSTRPQISTMFSGKIAWPQTYVICWNSSLSPILIPSLVRHGCPLSGPITPQSTQMP